MSVYVRGVGVCIHAAPIHELQCITGARLLNHQVFEQACQFPKREAAAQSVAVKVSAQLLCRYIIFD